MIARVLRACAMPALALVALGVIASSAFAQPYARRGADPFPHQKHAKLFPTCTGCHAGTTTGDAQAVMPPPSSCVECHDGTVQRRVNYTAATPKQDYLRFVHRDHARLVEPSGRECSSCHAASAGAAWMDVRRARPESCQSCHTHRAQEHLAPDSRCIVCHVPLARSQTLTVEQIGALPKPPSHEAARFIANHKVSSEAEAAQCATCHARESCARCHVNATDVPTISQLLPDTRVAALQRGKPATYLVPVDHQVEAWTSTHGRIAAASTQRCATCHARPSCTVCHTGTIGSAVIRRLPDGLKGIPGVRLVLPRRVAQLGGRRAVPASQALPHSAERPARDTVRAGGHRIVRPHPEGFDRQHAASAAGGRLTCEGCHAERFCSDCHAGESKRAFHAPNFVARHAPESYGRDLECSSCHNTEVFCRACHQSQGIAARAQRGGTYHNAQPLWLLQHGQAARRGLQSCTTCHVQRDCMQCHSQQGWGVSPHGPDFDPGRLGARAKVMCARCHLTDPTRGR